MPHYLNSQGQTVSASEATFDGKRTRPGYSAVVADGERVRMQPGDYLGFNIDMVDNRTSLSSVYLTDGKKEPASIDEAFRMAVEEEAKARSLKPTEWMATQRADDIEKLIRGVAEKFVARAGATGVASAFTFDAAANKLRAEHAHHSRLAQIDDEVRLRVAEARAAHNRKFSFMGDRAPGFDEAASAVIVRSKITSDSAAVLSAIRDAQYT